MSPDKSNVLLLTGGTYHDFSQAAQLITAALADRFNVTHTQDPSHLRDLTTGRYRAVVIYANDLKTDASHIQSLVNFVNAGGAFVPLHCANHCFLDSESYLRLVGSTFKGHDPLTEFSVDVADPKHPVVARTPNVTFTDEAYDITPTADFHVFLTAHWQGRNMPLGYEHTVGKGRVVYLANGHDARSLGNRYFQRWLNRAVRVAMGEQFNTKITTGILGYGGAFNMGKHHAEAVAAQHGMSVVAVCDLDKNRTEQAKHELGAHIKTWNDPQKFFNEGDFDLCIQILPHNLHAEFCIKAMEAGKHVVTEKPFCITLDEADRMIDVARRTGRMLSCFHNRRWDGDFLTILHLVRDGRIGEVFRIDAATGVYGMPRNWWRARKEISGGFMYDWGVHYCDWLLNLANKKVESVTGDFQKRKWHQSSNEDYTFALVRFVDGTTATLEQGSLAAAHRHSWRILGAEGAITADHPPGGDVTLHLPGMGGVSHTLIKSPKANWAAYYADVGNHLIHGERLVVTPEQARRAIGVICTAEQSAKQNGRPLPLPGEDSWQPDYLLPW